MEKIVQINQEGYDVWNPLQLEFFPRKVAKEIIAVGEEIERVGLTHQTFEEIFSLMGHSAIYFYDKSLKENEVRLIFKTYIVWR